MNDPFPNPPTGYEIIERFPVTSAYKEVFKAIRTTRIGKTPMVLKRYQPLASEGMRTVMKQFGFQSEVDIFAKDALTFWGGKLIHPNLVPCDIVENDLGEIFLVEPLLEVSLDRRFPNTAKQFLDWAENLLGGLAFLHKNDFVHSDIKPDNLGLYNGNAVVLDFGIATQMGETQHTKANPGSIKTRPPELFSDATKPTPKSDVWSLGASFYFLLTGGDYPFFSNIEVRSIPRPGAPERVEFEGRIANRIQAAYCDPEAFRKSLDKRLIDIGVLELLRHLTLRCISLDPQGRSDASSTLNWLEEDSGYFYQ